MQIVIHIGQQKTASTFIQNHLSITKEQLASQSVLVANLKQFYPNSGNDHAELLADFSKVVFSNENLYRDNANPKLPLQKYISDTKDVPKFLKQLLEAHATSWKIVCYLRRPDEHIVSQYQQKIKAGFIGSLDEFIDFRYSDDYYLYAQRMAHWAQVFGEDAMEVRLFHREALQGTPFEDFLRRIGVNYERLSFVSQRAANESLDRVNTEILRFLHCCRLKQPEVLRSCGILLHAQDKFDMKVRRMIRELDSGDRLQLETERAKHLQELFREDHEQLAERYFSPKHAAILLAPPAEVPPQPPLDRDILFERIMVLFNNPDLAHLAVEGVGQSGGALWARGAAVNLGQRAKRRAAKRAEP